MQSCDIAPLCLTAISKLIVHLGLILSIKINNFRFLKIATLGVYSVVSVSQLLSQILHVHQIISIHRQMAADKINENQYLQDSDALTNSYN